MIYREYGKTGKKVSMIGFGAMRFPINNDAYGHDYCIKMIRKAYDKGINYFDTAPFYCDDKSESLIGEDLEGLDRSSIFISTKSAEHTAEGIRNQLENSLVKLRTEYIDFYHIWRLFSIQDYRDRMAAYEEVIKAKGEGLVKHIVASTHCNGEEIEIIAKEGLFEGLTLGYNVMNSAYRDKGIKACFDHKMGVVTMNPLGGGIIPQRPEMFKFIDKQDIGLVSSAIVFNASHKEIAVVLTGMDSIEAVEQNTNAINDIKYYTKKEIKTISDSFGSVFDKLCTGCGYCIGCPEDIEIPKLMQAYNLKMIKGKDEDAVNMLRYHFVINNQKAKSCNECGICESKCTQHLPIIDRLKEVSKWIMD